jgi:Fur family transcriptional regulator, ferric uptake regulator
VRQTRDMTPDRSPSSPWSGVDRLLRGRGLRWTPQRRAVIEVLADADGHVTGAELVERCRAREASTIPSTVYRTLDLLEQLGLVRHGHGADGREEYHVLPEREHGHLHCAECGATWEIGDERAAEVVRAFREADGFELDLGHVTLVGRCAACAGGRVG